MKRLTVLAAGLFGGLVLVGCNESAQKPAGDDVKPLAVREGECRWAAGPIKIDGKLDEAAWQKAHVMEDFAVYWQNRKPKTATKARLLWDDNHIYFAGDMEDHDLFADTKERNAMTWLDDVFELFFKPAEDKLTYYEFQVNAANTHLELFLPSRGSGGYRRFAPLTKFGMESAVQLKGTLNKWEDKDAGWAVEGRIPWKAFEASGGKPKPGAKWRFALCRYDYSVTLEQPETSSTAPLTQPNFHRYEDYGTLTFVGPQK